VLWFLITAMRWIWCDNLSNLTRSFNTYNDALVVSKFTFTYLQTWKQYIINMFDFLRKIILEEIYNTWMKRTPLKHPPLYWSKDPNRLNWLNVTASSCPLASAGINPCQWSAIAFPARFPVRASGIRKSRGDRFESIGEFTRDSCSRWSLFVALLWANV